MSSSLAEFMSLIYIFCQLFFQLFFLYYVRNSDTTDSRQHTSSGGCLLQPAGYTIKSKIGRRHHLTILPKIHILFRGAREAHDTPYTYMHSTAKKRWAVMTDDGSQPPIEQQATAVHRGPATRSWGGPLLLVLLGGVVMLLVFYTCMLSDV